ncbi:MAG: hypothetical protein JSU09_19080 [Bacteroidetes bacterium]|nr:hypothetical protein [Bacteroidota bacterium]
MKQPFPFYKSVKAKSAAIFFVAFVVVIVPTNLIIYFQLEKILLNADTTELTSEIEKIISKTQLDPLVVPLPPVGYSLSLRLKRNDFTEIIFQSPNFPALANMGDEISSFQLDNLSVVTSHQPVGAVTLVATLARSNANLQKQLIELRTYLFLANLGALFLAGLLVFLASKIVIKPITKIIDAAEKIQASNSIDRVPVPKSNDESKLLADTLNGMIARIESSIKNQINFFASATHELKTPLAIMQTELAVALGQSLQSDTRKILESQLTEVQRLGRIIEDFLLISQLKSQTLTLRKSNERLEEPLYNAVKKLKYLATEKQSVVKIQMDDDIPLVNVDCDKIETVFTNLLENALRYSPAQSFSIAI